MKSTSVKIRTVYAERDDITFIMKAEPTGTGHKLTCTGWYHGEPDEEANKLYSGSLTAEYDYPISDIYDN